MNVKTITGSSIRAALDEARRLFGEDVVLIESIPPTGNAPARITVMTDAASVPVTPAAAVTAGSAPPSRFGYSSSLRTPPEPSSVMRSMEESTMPHEGFSAARIRTNGITQERPAPPASGSGDTLPARAEVKAVDSRERGRLFSQQVRTAPAPEPEGASWKPLEQLLEAQLKLLHDRIDQLERRLGETVIGASQQWIAHPLFAALLNQGLRPATATRLFDALAAKGCEPEGDEENVRWALAQEIRKMLDVAAPKRLTGSLLLVGPSGAGKTSLALKLATHPGFFGRRNTTVIIILPEREHETLFINPLERYKQAGIPAQCVQNEEEMHHALDRVLKFDQIIIDTPPMPSREGEARKHLLRVKQLVHAVMPIQVHLVVNATRALDEYNMSYMQRLALRPDAVALTHLDEATGWGRIAEWIKTIGLPVQFASTGPLVPDGITAFSPSWFVEEMMQL